MTLISFYFILSAVEGKELKQLKGGAEMAKRVQYNELSNPKLISICFAFNPWKEEELNKLLKGVERFATIQDRTLLILWGESKEEAKEFKGKPEEEV